MHEDRLRAVLDNVAEPVEEFVMTLEELRELVKKPRPTAYIGYEPSGPIHIGVLFTIEKLARLADLGFHSIALMADLHGFLNGKGPLELLKEVSLTYWSEVFRILGSEEIDIVLGTEYQLSEDYALDLLTLSQRVTARRAWRAMSMIARETEHPTVGQHLYPIMQALDILYLECDLAMGGTDQRKIHALARDLFSSRVELRHEKWVPVAVHFPLVPGLLPGGKMSSSIPKSHVAVHDPPEVVKKKIRAAFCPPPGDSQFDEEGKLINPILAMFKMVILPRVGKVTLPRAKAAGGGEVTVTSFSELWELYNKGELHPLDLKIFVADYFVERFKPVRERLEQDPDLIRPLYKLQSWQREHGLLGEEEWREVKKSLSPYLGEVS